MAIVALSKLGGTPVIQSSSSDCRHDLELNLPHLPPQTAGGSSNLIETVSEQSSSSAAWICDGPPNGPPLVPFKGLWLQHQDIRLEGKNVVLL